MHNLTDKNIKQAIAIGSPVYASKGTMIHIIKTQGINELRQLVDKCPITTTHEGMDFLSELFPGFKSNAIYTRKVTQRSITVFTSDGNEYLIIDIVEWNIISDSAVKFKTPNGVFTKEFGSVINAIKEQKTLDYTRN